MFANMFFALSASGKNELFQVNTVVRLLYLFMSKFSCAVHQMGTSLKVLIFTVRVMSYTTLIKPTREEGVWLCMYVTTMLLMI